MKDEHIIDYGLRKLAKEEDAAFRMVPAEHPNTPLGIVTELLENPAWPVCQAVLRGPNISRAYNNPNTCKQTLRILQKLAKSSNLDIKRDVGEVLKRIKLT